MMLLMIMMIWRWYFEAKLNCHENGAAFLCHRVKTSSPLEAITVQDNRYDYEWDSSNWCPVRSPTTSVQDFTWPTTYTLSPSSSSTATLSTQKQKTIDLGKEKTADQEIIFQSMFSRDHFLSCLGHSCHSNLRNNLENEKEEKKTHQKHMLLFLRRRKYFQPPPLYVSWKCLIWPKRQPLYLASTHTRYVINVYTWSNTKNQLLFSFSVFSVSFVLYYILRELEIKTTEN